MEDKYNKWNDLINIYFEIEEECISKINLINNIRNNLKKKLIYLNKDDILYYNCIIDNSYYYLKNSLKVNQIKFLKDLNNLLFKINKNNIFKIITLTKTDINLIINSYVKLNNDIIELKKNNIEYKWIKEDIDNLQEISELSSGICSCKTSIDFLQQDIENNIDKTINYHIKLINFLLSIIKLNYDFFNSN